jgi:hypothetical protein
MSFRVGTVRANLIIVTLVAEQHCRFPDGMLFCGPH